MTRSLTVARVTPALHRLVPVVVTAAVCGFVLQRVPLARLGQALASADYAWFLAFMVPNALVFFCWDTLVLAVVIRWFHGPIRYRDLLPARAGSYVVALANTNLARAALAGYLARQLRQPVLQLGSSVIFLVLTEYTHLIAWATIGLMAGGSSAPRELLWVPPAVAGCWTVLLLYTRFGVRPADVVRGLRRGVVWPRPSNGVREWQLLRTFRMAPLRRYAQIIGLRAPMFFVSLCAHYYAARAFDVHIPFAQLLAFLPVIFMVAALPITVARLGTTQMAWIYFFSSYAPEAQLLAFSLAAHATFAVSRAAIGLVFIPKVYAELVPRGTRPAA